MKPNLDIQSGVPPKAPKAKTALDQLGSTVSRQVDKTVAVLESIVNNPKTAQWAPIMGAVMAYMLAPFGKKKPKTSLGHLSVEPKSSKGVAKKALSHLKKKVSASPVVFQDPLGYEKGFLNHQKLRTRGLGSIDPAMRKHIDRVMASRFNRPIHAWQNVDTFRGMRGNQKLRGRWHIPSSELFAGTHLYTERKIEDFKGKKATLDLLMHGSGGSASSSRFSRTYRKNEYRIGASVEDAYANPSFMKKKDGSLKNKPYFDWRNMQVMPRDERMKAVTGYLANLVGSLEARLGCFIGEINMMGHSAGGRALNLIADLFPTGEIPIVVNGRSRIVKIKGYFNADAHYYENRELCNTYSSHLYKKALLSDIALQNLLSERPQKRDSISNRVRQICEERTAQIIRDFIQSNLHTGSAWAPKIMARLRQLDSSEVISLFKGKTTHAGIDALFPNRTRRQKPHLAILNAGNKRGRTSIPREFIRSMTSLTPHIVKKVLGGSLSTWKPPKYYSTLLDTGWRQQARLNRFLKKINGKPGVRTRDLDVDSRVAGLTDRRKHWHGFGKYSRDAMDFFT